MNSTTKMRLANIMGLDTNSAQHNIAITEALHEIQDVEAFLEYCRDKKEGIKTYGKLEKTERLDTLATRYKKIQATANIPLDTGKTFTSSIIKKIGTVKDHIKNEIEAGNERAFSRLKVNGEKYFTKKEINALVELKVSQSTIIEMFEVGTLKDELMKLFVSKFAIKKKYDLLSDNQKKVQKLTQGIIA